MMNISFWKRLHGFVGLDNKNSMTLLDPSILCDKKILEPGGKTQTFIKWKNKFENAFMTLQFFIHSEMNSFHVN
jgi:hypothetical protein